MANLYVTEYQGIGQVGAGIDGSSFRVPCQAPLGDGTQITQKILISGSSTQSAAFNRNTRLIRVHTDGICSIFVGGANPQATVGTDRLAANQTEYFAVNPGDKIAVIANT